MPKPAAWDSDPECGHIVTRPFQTHYCTYIRVPRLLTLQTVAAEKPEFLWLVTLFQWYELWFRVLLTDLHAARPEDDSTYEPVKLLRRGIELFRQFDLVADLAETILVRELSLRQLIHTANPADPRPLSDQFSQLLTLASALEPPAAGSSAGLEPAWSEYRARLDSFAARWRRLQTATLTVTQSPGPTYEEWLRLPELLSLQTAVKAGWAEEGAPPTESWKPDRITPDELMFVVVHQGFELWFKLLLDQIDRAIPALLEGDTASAQAFLHRVVLVQRALVQQIQLPATMQPLDFMRFRYQGQVTGGHKQVTGLSPASGTESYQFREIEIVSGLRDDPVFQEYLRGSDKLPIRLLTPRQQERLQQQTLGEAFRRAVVQRGLRRLDDLYTRSDAPNSNADLAQVSDLLIEFDEFFRMWRLGHVGMVEKMIGARSGTGFLGPEYLMETAGIRLQKHNRIFEARQVRPRFFEDLWEVRTRLGEAADSAREDPAIATAGEQED